MGRRESQRRREYPLQYKLKISKDLDTAYSREKKTPLGGNDGGRRPVDIKKKKEILEGAGRRRGGHKKGQTPPESVGLPRKTRVEMA